MRINATERTRITSRSNAKGKTAGGTFVPQSSTTSQSAAAAATVRTSPVVSIDTLIALQENEDFRQARKKATVRADELLDVLSDLRLGLLEGAIPLRSLHRLSAALERTRANTGDSHLESILNEIEVRAEVEKAKLDSAL